MLKNYEIDDEEQLANQIYLLLIQRSNLNLDVNDLINSGFDKVWAVDAVDGLLLFSADFGGPTRFAELRKVMENIFDSKWKENYEKIKDLPCCPPQSSRAYWWINNNKAFYRDSRLSPERIALLEQLSWWEWFKHYDDRWMDFFDQLKQCQQYPVKLPKNLENWTGKQRINYKAGKLLKDRIQLLETIPWWKWKPDRWKRNFDIVSVLKERPFPKTNNKATNWYYQQRVAYNRNTLPDDKIKRLESIYWWEWA